MRRFDPGVFYAAGAFVCWGVVVVYWKQLAHVPAAEILAHRIVWCAVFAIALVALLGRLGPMLEAIRRPRRLGVLALTGALITFNWGLFIWAVNEGRILDTSLGYYINPLVNIVLGLVLLGEKLTRLQQAAVALAAAAVVFQTAMLGVFPWIGITLALTFGLYGYLRKVVPVDSLEGLAIESLLVAPFAAVALVLLWAEDRGAFLQVDLSTDALLLLAGPVTAIPLMLFAAGARRIRLSTVGFLQYLAPSITALLAVWVYGELFTWISGVTFALIWTALAMVSAEAVRREVSAPRPEPPAATP